MFVLFRLLQRPYRHLLGCTMPLARRRWACCSCFRNSQLFKEIQIFVQYVLDTGIFTIVIIPLVHPLLSYAFRNMEEILNIKSLGNLNRQFVSLLRSEQDSSSPIIGDPSVWEGLMGPENRLTTLDEAFAGLDRRNNKRSYPYMATLHHIWKYPRTILPGTRLAFAMLDTFFRRGLATMD